MRPHVEELARVADTALRHPNAGLPNAFGDYDETPGGDRRTSCASSPRAGLVNIVGGCCGTTPGAHRAPSPAAAGCRRAPSRPSHRPAGSAGLEPLTIDPRQPVRERRRAHQRHRLGQVPQADRGGRLRGGGRRRAPAGRERRADASTSTWTRACSIPQAAMTPFLNLIAARARHRAGAGDDRLAPNGR